MSFLHHHHLVSRPRSSNFQPLDYRLAILLDTTPSSRLNMNTQLKMAPTDNFGESSAAGNVHNTSTSVPSCLVYDTTTDKRSQDPSSLEVPGFHHSRWTIRDACSQGRFVRGLRLLQSDAEQSLHSMCRPFHCSFPMKHYQQALGVDESVRDAPLRQTRSHPRPPAPYIPQTLTRLTDLHQLLIQAPLPYNADLTTTPPRSSR